MPAKSQILDPATGLPVPSLAEQEQAALSAGARYDSPYGAQYGKGIQQALGMLQAPTLAPGQRATTGAEGQMWQGLEQQQRLAQAQASRRGFNPLAARAGQQAGAEMQSRGLGVAQQLRAQEEAARRAALLGVYQQQSQFGLREAGMASERMQQQLQQQAQDAAIQAQLDEQARQQEAAIGQGILGLLGSVGASLAPLAVASDKRMKRKVKRGGKDIDALMGALGSEYNG